MSDKCSHCSASEFMAERTDAFTTANALLRGANFPPQNDGEPPYTYENVMTLACFLIGMGDE